MKNNASHLSGFNQAELQHELHLIRGRGFLPFLRPTLPVPFLCFTLASLTINIYKHYNGNTLKMIKSRLQNAFSAVCELPASLRYYSQLLLSLQTRCTETASSNTVTLWLQNTNWQASPGKCSLQNNFYYLLLLFFKI